MPATAGSYCSDSRRRIANGGAASAASGGLGGGGLEADERLRAALQEMDDIMKGE